jgi:ComF family protein
MIALAAEFIGSVVSPARCAGCDAHVARLVVFCPACRSTVEFARPSTAELVAAFTYGGAIARAIGRLKYERRADLARPLGDLLWRALEPHASSVRDAVVVPVPLHPSRLVKRGYNQATLIARVVARRLDAPLRALALARSLDTPHQTALDRDARRQNVTGAFRVRCPELVRDRGVLLIDDVRTTGATLEACTSALASAGASRVTHAVVARVWRDDT